MDKSLKELMQVTVIGENVELSNLLQDIMPIREQRFTDLELEADKKECFSLVIYKKQNPIIKFLNSIKLSFEKIKIMRQSGAVTYIKNQDNKA